MFNFSIIISIFSQNILQKILSAILKRVSKGDVLNLDFLLKSLNLKLLQILWIKKWKKANLGCFQFHVDLLTTGP